MKGEPKIRAVFKRMETDAEYRERLMKLPSCWGDIRSHARAFTGTTLDSVGELLKCPRRIVEDVA